jgi:nitrogen-specific signal transduction histidine kinase
VPILNIFPVPRYDNRKLFLIFFLVATALVIDISISNVADMISKQAISVWGISLFIAISAIYTIGQYYILETVKAKTRISKIRTPFFSTLEMMVTIVQYALTAIMVIVVLQIVVISHYHTNLLTLATSASYGLAVFLMALLSYQLFSWFKLNPNFAVLIYALAAAMITINAIDSIVYFDVVLLGKPVIVSAQSKVIFQTGFNPGTPMSIVSLVQTASLISYFLLTWSGTIIVLRHHIQRVGRIKFWIVVMLPLVYFMSYYVTLYEALHPTSPVTTALSSDLILPILLYTYSASICGVLFGFGFRFVSRSINQSSHVRDYMIITAYGFILYFITGGATVLQAGYPPFGLANVSFVGLASFLILVGLYHSAISVAHDVKLRKTIKKSAMEESKLLVSIGAAQMEQEIQRRVLKNTKEQQETLTQQTGVQSSLTEYEIKQYLTTVLREIKIIQNVDEILKKQKDILEDSHEFLVCSKLSGLLLAYNNYFDLYEKVMQKYRNDEHVGIRIVTSIRDKEGADLSRLFINAGVEIKHVKNMPPIDFALSDKEMIATIQKVEGDEIIQNLLISNELPYIEHFNSIFEELWETGKDAEQRIKDIEEGVDSEGIEIIQNPVQIQKTCFNLIKSATDEILIIFPSANAFHHQEHVGTIQLLEEMTGRGIKVRILTPTDKLIEDALQNLRKRQQQINIRYVEPHLQTKVTLLVVDRKFSLIIELKEDTNHNIYQTIGLATYSNSKSTVLSYVSIFEGVWKQTELYERLKIHDKMQEEFINIAAHELRTPIQPLLFNSESLKRIMPDEERISIIIRNAKKLQTLANNILDITRIESQSLQLKKERVNLTEVLLHSIKDIKNQILDSGKIKVVYDPKEDFFVEADKERITQVISNLLGNAIKFTKEGSISITEQMNDNKEVVVNVHDTGSGIDPEIMPRLFTKFATKSDTGTGLGLFISKSIIEAHGGRIWAENNNDGKGGATFTLSLPLLS